MKWRAIIPAIFVLIVFGALVHYYNRGFVHQRAHGVILMIANGFDQEILNQARIKSAARGQKLFLDHMPSLGGNPAQTAFLTVQGLETPAPDECAAATMLATGVKVRNGFTAITHFGQRTEGGLMYRAQSFSRGTGLVTTGELTMPTPVSFYGYIQGNESAEFRNASELVDSSKIDVIMGGGGRYFRPVHPLNEGGRLDGRDLVKDAGKWGYSVVNNAQDLDQLSAWKMEPFPMKAKCLGLFHQGPFYFSALRAGSSVMPTLSDMTRRSIELLQSSRYFLVVEGAQIGQACRSNFMDLAVDEAIAFDESVKTAVTYAGKESTVIVVCGYSYGAIPQQTEVAKPLSGKSSVQQEFQWLLGPGGVPQTPQEKLWMKQKQSEGAFNMTPNHPLNPGRALLFSKQARPSMGQGWVMVTGFGSESFGGVYSISDLYSKIENLFK